MTRFKLPTTEEAARLKEMSEQLAKLPRRPEPGRRPDIEQLHDVYVARLPEDGIPAREGLFPGCAECEIYQLEDLVGSGTTGNCDAAPVELTAVTVADEAYAEVVYNLSSSAVTDEFSIVLRDKYGSFFVFAGGGGTGVQAIRFRLTDEIFCELCQARAVILSRPPGVATVYGEDEYGEVMVYDLGMGLLNEPYDDLVGRVGYALLMEWETEECAIDPNLPIKWEMVSLGPVEEGCAS